MHIKPYNFYIGNIDIIYLKNVNNLIKKYVNKKYIKKSANKKIFIPFENLET